MGPSAIRYAGLDDRITELGRRCEDLGDVETAVAEATSVVDERVRYLPQIKATCGRIAELAGGAAEGGDVRADRRARRRRRGRRLLPARAGRRPLGGARHARRARASLRAGRC